MGDKCAAYWQRSEAVAEELADVAMAATAVGNAALPYIIPSLAKGLERRRQKSGAAALDYHGGNVRHIADYMRQELIQILPPDYQFNELVGLVETSIGKMVRL